MGLGEKGEYFHRRQLEDIIGSIGLSYYKFYYPMPDYGIVGCVYTDECSPNAKEWKNFINCGYKSQDTLQLDISVLEDFIANGTFPILTNSFCLEAGRYVEHNKLKSIRVLSESKENNYQCSKGITYKKVKTKREIITNQLSYTMTDIDYDRKLLDWVIEV